MNEKIRSIINPTCYRVRRLTLPYSVLLRAFCSMWVFALLFFSVHAATFAVEIPKEPFLKPVPNNASWAITMSYPIERANDSKSETHAPPPDYLKTLTRTIFISRFKNLAHEEIVNGQGVGTDYWFIDSAQYTKPTGSMFWQVAYSRPGETGDYHAIPSSGYEGLEWIRKEAYVGTVPVAGRPYLLFVLGKSMKLDGSNVIDQIGKLSGDSVAALIDSDTRLPALILLNGVMQSYEFKDPPNNLSLPKDLLDEIAKAEKTRAILNLPAPR